MKTDLQIAAQKACTEIGVIFRAVPADGKFHQLDVEGKATRNGSGRIRLFPDGEGGQLWNHVTDETRLFWAKCDQTLTPAEVEERKLRTKEEREKSERKLAEVRQKTAKLAVDIWKVSLPPVDSLYWHRKQVEPTDTIREIALDTLVDLIGYHPKAKGKRFTGERVQIIPVRGDNGVSTVEMIDETGLKAGLADGQKKGCFWSSAKLPEGNGAGLTFGIGEGVATMLTYCMAAGSIGIATLSCNNLKAVAEYFRLNYPQAKIIIISDIGNGEHAAEDSARSVNALIVKPTLPEGSTGSDINDLHCEVSLDEARRQIEAAKSVVETMPIKDELRENSSSWPEPLLFGVIETPEIPTWILPTWLGAYSQAVSDDTKTPPGLAIMFALSTVAACLQKKFEVSPYQDRYREPVNLWTVTALEPGNRKTAVKNAFTAPLTLWEKDQIEILTPKIKKAKHQRDINLKAIENLKLKAAKPDGDRKAVLKEIAEIEEETPEETIYPRLWSDDTTPERLQTLLAEQKDRMALISDEGGIFEIMSGLYSGGKANLNVFLQSHAGSDVRVERQGRSVTLHKPALTFGLAVQPDIISKLASGNACFRGNGTLARFLYCLPKSPIGTRDINKRASIPESVEAAYNEGMMSLLRIEPVQDHQGREAARILTLTPDALQIYEEFNQFIETRQGPQGEYYSIQDWTAKLPGAALRIAGLLHVVEHGADRQQITGNTAERAFYLAKLLISHARAAFSLMGDDPAAHDAKHIFQWLLSSPRKNHFRQTDIYKGVRRFNDADRVSKAMKVLSARHITSEPIKRGTAGRPSIMFEVNPAIYEKSQPG